jgi:hypothetical protein
LRATRPRSRRRRSPASGLLPHDHCGQRQSASGFPLQCASPSSPSDAPLQPRRRARQRSRTKQANRRAEGQPPSPDPRTLWAIHNSPIERLAQITP